ncbi:MAG: hypothetical protein V1720_19925 [bacterium]
MDEHLLNKIISVAYNDARIVDKIHVRYLALKNPEIKKLFEEYRSTYGGVHNIKIDECPDEIVEKVLSSVKMTESKKKSFKDDLFTMFVLNPRATAYVATAATLLIIFSVVFNINRNENNYGSYSKEEVLQANKQIKESLALIGKVFNKTQSTITDEVFGKRVGKPINKSINTINNLFLEGGKNENTN